MRLRNSFTGTVALLVVAGLAHTSAQTGTATGTTLTWPLAFVAESPDPMDGALWHEEVVQAEGLEVRLPYPDGWKIEPGSEGSLLVARSADGTSLLSITHPLPAPFTMEEPMPDDRLAATARELAGAAADVKLLASGQMRAPGGNLWTWFEVQAAADALPTELSLLERMHFDGTREWTFATTTGGQFVTMHCTSLLPRGGSDAAQQSRVLESGRECGAMLRRLSVRVPRS